MACDELPYELVIRWIDHDLKIRDFRALGVNKAQALEDFYGQLQMIESDPGIVSWAMLLHEWHESQVQLIRMAFGGDPSPLNFYLTEYSKAMERTSDGS